MNLSITLAICLMASVFCLRTTARKLLNRSKSFMDVDVTSSHSCDTLNAKVYAKNPYSASRSQKPSAIHIKSSASHMRTKLFDASTPQLEHVGDAAIGIPFAAGSVRPGIIGMIAFRSSFLALHRVYKAPRRLWFPTRTCLLISCTKTTYFPSCESESWRKGIISCHEHQTNVQPG